MKNNIINISKTVFTVGTLLGFVALAGAATWTAPTATAPAGNVDAPLNVSATAQTKPGAIAVTGLVNWGTSLFSGKTMIGGSTAPATLPTTPALTVNGGPSFAAIYVPNGQTTLNGALHVLTGGIDLLNGDVKIASPSGHFYENGHRVCLESGAGCPTTTGGGTTDSLWSASGANINNTNTGNVGIGTSSPIHKLDVNGVIRSTGNIYGEGQAIISGGLRLGAGGAPANPLSVTGNADVSGNMSVVGSLTTGRLNTSYLVVTPAPGVPSVLMTMGDGSTRWQPLKKVKYGCDGTSSISRLDDGRMLVMSESSTDLHCVGPDLGGGLGVYGYLLSPYAI